MDSTCKLTDLTKLVLSDFLKYFSNNNVCRLAQSLLRLKVFCISSSVLTDTTWEGMAQLRSLRSLTVVTATGCSVAGVLQFISRLGFGNKGLFLSIMNKDRENNFSEDTVAVIEDALSLHLDGRFQYGFAKGECSCSLNDIKLTRLDTPDWDSEDYFD